MEVIIDFFVNLERLGPGDDEQSKKALNCIRFETNSPKIADIGCGTGSQTIFLAKETNCEIIAVDFLQPFLNELDKRAKLQELNVKTICASMDDLPFSEKSFDLIWSEGAIYNIGFNNGINYWKKYLKHYGYLAITELSWFTDKRPKEIEDFWKNAYSGIDTVKNNVCKLEKNGYKTIDHFALPNKCWDNYYEPMKKEFETFLKKWENKKEVEDFVNEQIIEIEMYKKYNQYCGYEFYIAQNYG